MTAPELLDAIVELWTRIPETGSRLRQRLEAVFDDTKFRGHCSGNPARAIRRKLREAVRDRVKAAYNRAKFSNERRALLLARAEYLDGKVAAGNVVEFRPQMTVAT